MEDGGSEGMQPQASKKLTLTQGLKLLFNKPLTKPEKWALQSVDACNVAVNGNLKELVSANFVPILQEVTSKYVGGQWHIEDGEPILLTEWVVQKESDVSEGS
jgi:hypothetical protein